MLVAVLFVAGCGGGGSGGSTQTSDLATKPAGQVVQEAAKAAEDASSFHISGQIHSASGLLGAQGIGVDLSVVRGKGATGSITIGGGELDLIVTGSSGYLRASADVWTKLAKQSGGGAGAAFAGQLFGGKWVKFPANNKQFGSLTDPTNTKSLFKSLTSSHGRLVNKGETTYKGQSVVAIQDTTKGGMLYVAASGTPYPVALTKLAGKQGGAITFDKWNEPVSLAAPKGALDLSNFMGG